MEQRVEVCGLGEGGELGVEMIVGGEVMGFDGGVWVAEGGGLSLEAEDCGALGAEGLGEGDAEFSGGEVGEAAHLVDGFEAGAAGDEESHWGVAGTSWG